MKITRFFVSLLLIACLVPFVACKGKTKTILNEVYLIQNPEDKKIAYVPNSKLKRGEFVKVIDEKVVNQKKYYYVQIEDVDVKGWIAENYVHDGKLESVTVLTDTDLYMRPSIKSDKIGKVFAGQIAFKIDKKGDFVLIQYPGKEGYVLKDKVGTGEIIIKKVTIPGIGSATVNASSQLVLGEGRELEFDPRNAFDGSLQTAWCEGKSGDTGVGEWIQISFDQCINLEEVSIVNGWSKSEDLYKTNTRVAQLKITSNKGGEAVVELSDGIFDFQKFDISLKGSSFKFIITKVYPGKDSDTCISEISLKSSSNQCEDYYD
ncbi:MAG TPA: discoidin domain-containing protein [Spirochaetota bacterium]|nr:discoidin domain-containing protein [Spirochaetota bacterium]HOM88372.1 discoidin domain-containing protein [Spirochaetota bacterium]HOT20589.1 discoidin domain-containing protein [Spirochaetota bacterium]HPD05294.1 discoidin domain-containing protein [Spirochaetota bacterium]HQG41915.1 discoidin domain-containing protein [Spirochaetota bacterium]